MNQRRTINLKRKSGKFCNVLFYKLKKGISLSMDEERIRQASSRAQH
jgi:hypothetical protein